MTLSSDQYHGDSDRVQSSDNAGTSVSGHHTHLHCFTGLVSGMVMNMINMMMILMMRLFRMIVQCSGRSIVI